MKIYDLPVMGYDRAKSFYGKAKVIEKDNGEKVLLSYNTEVCKIGSNGEFVRLWDGYSVTTMRHINSFLSFFGIPGGGKAWWNSQPVEIKKVHSNMTPNMTPYESLKAMYFRRFVDGVNH